MCPTGEVPNVSAQVMRERTSLQIPGVPEWIEPTVEYLRRKAVLAGVCQEAGAGKLMIALHEALTNAVIHGNLELSSDLKETGAFAPALAERLADPRLVQRTIDIEVDFDSARCLWTITDQGRGFDVDEVTRRCLDEDPTVLLASGRGILIMRSFMDEVNYDLGGRRVMLCLRNKFGDEKRLEPRMQFTGRTLVEWEQHRVEGFCRELSKGGVSLLTTMPVPENVTLLFTPATAGHKLRLHARVLRCSKLAEGLYDVAAQFVTQDR